MVEAVSRGLGRHKLRGQGEWPRQRWEECAVSVAGDGIGVRQMVLAPALD